MKFAVFVSGKGSNLQSIIDSVKAGEIKAELTLVFSNNYKAPALTRAKEAGIKTLFLNPKDYVSRLSFDREVAIHLKQEGIDFIVLAGYMLLLSPQFVKDYTGKILNVHPSLLPSFKGAQGIKDALTYGAKVTGVTVHLVDDKMDHGPIIMQESLKIADDDTVETLSTRIHNLEHRIYPKAISLYADGKIKTKGRRVEIIK